MPHDLVSGSGALSHRQNRWDNPAGMQMDGMLAKTVVRTLVAHFRENLDQPMMLRELAEDMGHSSFCVIRAFRKLTGITPMRYLSALRLYRAKQMLLRTGDSVISICYEVGYESLGSFNNRFKAVVGLTPTGLRQLRDQLDPHALLPVCGGDADDALQLRATAYFAAGNAYARLAGLKRAPHTELPGWGQEAVAFAIPWSGDVNALLLPRSVLRSEPLGHEALCAVPHLPDIALRQSTEFDPPLLPVLAAGEAAQSVLAPCTRYRQ
ncbi:helix-turn-helix domain-containing protein [Puniceibacterium sediminis]|uniref:AraC-type DNA-binding protein n=1 Tax=Puniceibacterium sediminis TaxID=1608407 RepID=A0A238Z4N4_9RHOB|nr:AraC family transcriptional regulator [Puniceibacterium sediminis]SNR77793.1 AraC-type DNA-binding protein [Puniceibacterium sediminis]